MGLDFAELVIDVEEEFGISIPDEEAQQCNTVGDLITFVQACVCAKASWCWTGHAFQALRDVIVAEAGVARAGLRPSTSLSKALPRRALVRVWPKLDEHLRQGGLDLPGLRLSVAGCVLLVLALFAAIGYAVGLIPPHLPRIVGVRALIGLAAWIAVFAGAMRLLVNRLPPRCITMGDLARAIRATASRAQIAAAPPAPLEIQAKVIELVSKRLDIPVEKITLSSRFVEDLGAG
jgi:acyl carrier protein